MKQEQDHPSVVIGFCHPAHDVAMFHTNLRQLMLHDAREHGYIADVIDLESSPRIAAARNQIVERFLASPHDYLFMLDSDILVRENTLDLLVASTPDVPAITSGLYFGGRLHGRQNAHIYRLNEDNSGFVPIEGVKGPGQWGPIIPIHAVGAGCLLMHRDALTRIGDHNRDSSFPWFVEGTGGGREIGEDMSFCLRALQLGIPIVCNTSVIVGHVKLGVIDERTFLGYLMDREAVGDEGIEQELMQRLRLDHPEAKDPSSSSLHLP